MKRVTRTDTLVYIHDNPRETDNGQNVFNDMLNERIKFLGNKYNADVKDIQFNVEPVFYPGYSRPTLIYTALIVYTRVVGGYYD